MRSRDEPADILGNAAIDVVLLVSMSQGSAHYLSVGLRLIRRARAALVTSCFTVRRGRLMYVIA